MSIQSGGRDGRVEGVRRGGGGWREGGGRVAEWQRVGSGGGNRDMCGYFSYDLCAYFYCLMLMNDPIPTRNYTPVRLMY